LNWLENDVTYCNQYKTAESNEYRGGAYTAYLCQAAVGTSIAVVKKLHGQTNHKLICKRLFKLQDAEVFLSSDI
jgi:hypothetical protein